MTLWADAAAVALKDARLMIRGRGGLAPVLVFGALTVLVLAFALSAAVGHGPAVAAGILWVVLFLSGELALVAAWRVEQGNGALEGYLISPADPLALFVGKLAVGLCLMGILAALTMALFAVFFGEVRIDAPWALAASVGLGALGFMAGGLLLGTLGGASRGTEGLLSLVLFPLLVPDLLASVATSQSAMSGASPGPWWQVLVGFDILFVALALILFEASVEVSD